MLINIYKILLFSIFSCLNFPAYGQEVGAELSEIKLDTSIESNYFIDAVKNENLNFIDKNNLEFNLNSTPELKGRVEFGINERSSIKFNIDETDKNKVFSDKSKESLDINADFSSKLTNDIDINTDVSLQNMNNHSNNRIKISDFNISTEIIPHHKLYFGQVGISDKNSSSLAIFDELDDQYNLAKLQSVEDVDLKIEKDSGLINYSVGIYNLNNTETELRKNKSISGGLASFKPFHQYSKAGELQVGGGYFTNQHSIKNELDREDAYSIFSGYKFSRFSLRGEFLRKNSVFYEGQYSDSWHFTNKFAVTKNLDFKTGFKQFEETGSTINDVGFEYAPFFKDNRLKFELNASFIKLQENSTKDSRRLNIKIKYSF